MKVRIETAINIIVAGHFFSEDVTVTAEFVQCDPDYLPGEEYLDNLVVKLPDGYEITDIVMAHQTELFEDLLLDEGRKRSKLG